MTKKEWFWLVFGLLSFVALVYGIIMLLANNLMFGIAQNGVQVENPANALDNGGALNGTLTVNITNPTPFSFAISSVYAEITDPDGNVLATIDEPFALEIKPNGTTEAQLQFTAQVVTAMVSAVIQLMGKSEGATVSGKVYLLRGLVPVAFSESVNITF